MLNGSNVTICELTLADRHVLRRKRYSNFCFNQSSLYTHIAVSL